MRRRRSRGSRRAAGVSLAALLLAGGVSAQPASGPRPVALTSTACEPARIGDVEAVLRVELFNRVAEGPAPADAYRATVECQGDRVALSVASPGGPARAFQASLGSVPPSVRARVVALALAELVRDLDREKHAEPPPPPPPPPPPIVEREPPPASEPTPAPSLVALEAFAGASGFSASGAWLVGGGLRFHYAYRHFSAGLDASLLTSSERFTPGSAQTTLAYGSPSVAWRQPWGQSQLELGAGYAFGAARLSGQATAPGAFAGTVSGAWSAPYAFTAFTLGASDVVRIDARAQIGWVTAPVAGDVAGGAEVALENLWASFQLGATLVL